MEVRLMITDLVQIRRLGEQKRKENEELRRHMKRHATAERRLRNVAGEIEDAADCTVCANCCRVATSKITERDVEKLAKFFRVKPSRILADFTERSEEEGLILKRNEKGCVFLEGNLCTVYEARPATCGDFPHLVRGPGSLVSRMWEMPDRATYCPIAYNTLEAFKTETGFGGLKK
jgi:hypothetical protein